MKLRTLSILAALLSVGAGGRLLLAAAGQERPSQIVTPPPEITIQDTPVGPMLADVKGFTLYVTDRDKDPGKSSCYGPCAEQWVPLRAQTDTQPVGEWSLVPREDGRPQWAYKGRPLYRYRWEGKPRWAEAQNEVWRYASLSPWPVPGAGRRGFAAAPASAKIVLPPSPGGITGQVTRKGNVFADSKGMTLYSRSSSAPSSACNGSCLESWVVLAAPQAASPIGSWTIVAKDDGTQQWAYQGRPVYRSLKDVKPSDTNGANDEWQPIPLPSAATPASAPTAPKNAATVRTPASK
jgi:predicted lipoprotein with Yx(FWY)xxD motif